MTTEFRDNDNSFSRNEYQVVFCIFHGVFNSSRNIFMLFFKFLLSLEFSRVNLIFQLVYGQVLFYLCFEILYDFSYSWRVVRSGLKI